MRSLDDVNGIAEDFARLGVVSEVTIPDLSARELWEQVQVHRSFPHWAPLVEAILASSAVTPEFVEIVVSEVDDAGILDAVVTSGKAPEPALERLAANHASPRSVREHAFVALLRRRLPRLDSDEFGLLMQMYSGDTGIAPGVRHVLASSRFTPVPVLERLARDEVDFVRETAVATLADRASNR